MKQLSIIKFSDVNHKKKDWYDFYKSIKNHKINKAPWKNNFFYFPKAEFSIAWNNYGFFISFFVAENEVLA